MYKEFGEFLTPNRWDYQQPIAPINDTFDPVSTLVSTSEPTATTPPENPQGLAKPFPKGFNQQTSRLPIILQNVAEGNNVTIDLGQHLHGGELTGGFYKNLGFGDPLDVVLQSWDGRTTPRHTLNAGDQLPLPSNVRWVHILPDGTTSWQIFALVR